jgi:hypothetical protein
MKYSFQKLNWISKINKLLDARPSKLDGFLYEDTCVSSTHLNMPICSKDSLSPPLKLSFEGCIPF